MAPDAGGVWPHHRQHLDHGHRHLLFQIPEPLRLRRRDRLFHRVQPAAPLLGKYLHHRCQLRAAGTGLHLSGQERRRPHRLCDHRDVGEPAGTGRAGADARYSDRPADAGAGICHYAPGDRFGDPVQHRRILGRNGCHRHDFEKVHQHEHRFCPDGSGCGGCGPLVCNVRPLHRSVLRHGSGGQVDGGGQRHREYEPLQVLQHRV